MKETVIISTFNLEYGCEKYGSQKAAHIISKSGSSIVLLQEIFPSSHSEDGGETHQHVNIVRDIAIELGGWYYVTFTQSATAIISSLPITVIGEGGHYGLAKTNNIYVCVVHFSDYPYIAFEAVGIKYPAECSFFSDNPIELQNRSFSARLPELEELDTALRVIPKDAIIVIGGDFNEPSHLDWTAEAVEEGLVPFVVNFPTTKIMEHRLGFVDAYRHLHPDPVVSPGYTWPDRDPGYKFRRDRIDFLFINKKYADRILLSCRVIPTLVSDHSIVNMAILLQSR